MTARWLPGNLLAFDTETTGPDPLTARIISAACVEVGAAGVVSRRTWLVNPGIPIPPEATAIHGITDGMAAKGTPHSTACVEIANVLMTAWARGLPVVAMCAPYDLTVLNNGLAPLDRWMAGSIPAVLDPLVIDRACDPYRKGKRRLIELAAHYGVRLDGAHSSDGDALAAARVVWKQARLYGEIAEHTLAEMQAFQANAHAAWAANFEAHLRKQGKNEIINLEWPMRRTNVDTRAA